MPRVRRCRQPGCHMMVKLPDHYCAKHYEHEAEYLASRQKWTRSDDRTTTHKYNTVTRYRNETKREQYNFYRTKQWSHLRQQVLDRDHYLCRYCQAIGKLTPNSKIVDHIRPIEIFPDDKDNINNLATICWQCHALKTKFEQKYYGCGQGNIPTDAKPIDDIDELVLLMRRN
ncbi:HNH endonuclease [Limosilactobacillus fermentum]